MKFALLLIVTSLSLNASAMWECKCVQSDEGYTPYAELGETLEKAIEGCYGAVLNPKTDCGIVKRDYTYCTEADWELADYADCCPGLIERKDSKGILFCRKP